MIGLTILSISFVFCTGRANSFFHSFLEGFIMTFIDRDFFTFRQANNYFIRPIDVERVIAPFFLWGPLKSLGHLLPEVPRYFPRTDLRSVPNVRRTSLLRPRGEWSGFSFRELTK